LLDSTALLVRIVVGRSQLLLIVLALLETFGCKRPAPPTNRMLPSASASAAVPVPALVDACSRWRVQDSTAHGALELWCEKFGPCPRDPLEAAARKYEGGLTVHTASDVLSVSYGLLDGREFYFDRKGRPLGGRVWDDLAFGDCKTQGIVSYRGGTVPEPGWAGDSFCWIVPGRNLTEGQPCRCERPTDRPLRVRTEQGPQIRTTLECLYEFGVAGSVCENTLDEQRRKVERLRGEAKEWNEMVKAERGPASRQAIERSKFSASERAVGCGRTRVAHLERAVPADCVYDSAGRLIELRFGKRYVTENFDAKCTP